MNDLQQFRVEDEHLPFCDLSCTECRRDPRTPFFADRHQLHALGPAGQHLRHGDHERARRTDVLHDRSVRFPDRVAEARDPVVTKFVNSKGGPGKIQVDRTTFQRLNHLFEFDAPETVHLKGKGETAVYRLTRIRIEAAVQAGPAIDTAS